MSKSIKVGTEVKVGAGEKVYTVAGEPTATGNVKVEADGKSRYVKTETLTLVVAVKAGKGFTPFKKAMRFGRHEHPDASVAERQDFATSYAAYAEKTAAKGGEVKSPAAFYEKGYGKVFA